jgi:hypothetical protein
MKKRGHGKAFCQGEMVGGESVGQLSNGRLRRLMTKPELAPLWAILYSSCTFIPRRILRNSVAAFAIGDFSYGVSWSKYLGW